MKTKNILILESKICPKCGQEKQFIDFHNNVSTKSGKSSWCKKCNNNFSNNYRKIKNPNYKLRCNPYFNVPEGTKRCTKCKIIKSIIEFNKKSLNTKDELNSWCKKCCNICYKEFKKNHPELIKKYENNRNRIKRKESQQNWNKNNPEKLKESKRKYYKNNSKKIKKSVRNWKKLHPDKLRKYITKRDRNLGYFELFGNPFPEDIPIEFHHINNFVVVPIPKKLHRSCSYPSNILIHRQRYSIILMRTYGINFNDVFNNEK